MILQGNQRGGSKNLALHLLKEENEHVELHELRGFVSDNLGSALNEIYAVSRGTKARQYLFSLSLNPPREEKVSTDIFENAINRVENELGLIDQPRAIVFHEKNGRRHAHAVWSRIDTQDMKAIPLPFTKYKLMDISRELYRDHGWNMPRGFIRSEERDPANFTLAQWQQAKRSGKNPKAIKKVFQECWAVSDTQKSFQQALKERGYILARGDRRGFVALDYACEVFAVPKWVGIKTKEACAKLNDQETLPSVDEAREQMANTMSAHLETLKKQQDTAIKKRISEIEQKRMQMVEKHTTQREELQRVQNERYHCETQARQERYRKGLTGLIDRITGRHRQIKKQNERETELAKQRDQKEKDTLIFEQLDQRRILQTRIERLNKFSHDHSHRLSDDIEQYQNIKERKLETTEFKRSHPKSQLER